MKQLTSLAFGVFILVSIQSCQSNKHASNYNDEALVGDSDITFLKNGTEGSLTTIKASGLALSNSKNMKVIQFAKSMIDVHTQLADDLEKLQADNFVTTDDTINTIHQQAIAALEKKRAASFDKAYLAMLITDHTQAISLFNAASKDKNADISSFVKKTLPALKMHLDSARAISLTLK
jgi:putative membrane protein